MDTTQIDNENFERMKSAFAPERWAKLERQALNQGLDADALQQLCTSLLASSFLHHSENAEATLYSVANRLLLSLGSTLTAEDIQRFEDALKTPSKPAKKRGGKHDSAPVPA